MATSDSKLNIIIDAQDRTKGAFKSLDGQLSRSNNSLGSMAGTAAKLTAGFYAIKGAFSAVSGVLSTGFGVAAQMQTAQVGLETLLGSSEAAATTIARLKVEAARTPFELPGLSQATQLLSSVTKDGDRSIDILLDVGEALAAMGKGQAELDRIVVNLQQVAAVGRASSIDIKQFAFAGIPIYEMLAETTGKTGEALQMLIEDGGITFDTLTTMFDRANDSGGQFFNAFKNQSGTFNQSLSNLKDSFGLFAADVVEKSGLFDGVTKGMQHLSVVFSDYETTLATIQITSSQFLTQLETQTGIVSQLSASWQSIRAVFIDQLLPSLMQLWAALQPFQPLLEFLAKVIGATLVFAVKAAIAVLTTIIMVMGQLLTGATKVSTFFYEVLGGAFDWILKAIEPVSEAVKTLVNFLQKAINLGGSIGGKVSGLFSGKSKSVDDAVISPKGDIISTHPEDYIIATKNPGSLFGGGRTVNLYITGNTLLDRDAGVIMGDSILNKLRLSNAM